MDSSTSGSVEDSFEDLLEGMDSSTSGSVEDLLEGMDSGSVEDLLIKIAATKVQRFSHSDLKRFTSNFENEAGSGAFGKVYKGQFSDGVKVAVKVLNGFAEETFVAELSTICMTSHRYLVKLYGFCFDDNIKALVYEYVENGSLDKILYENKFGLDWEKLYGIAIDTAKGLSYLHDGCHTQIIHHDVKAGNILLDSNFCPKLTDFGLAKRLNTSASHRTNTAMRGTPNYVAPEMLYPYARVSYKCDVYSFGMLLFEILGTRNNGPSEKWFPLEVWRSFEIGQLEEFIIDCGIRETCREKAKTLSMVALWCAQYAPDLRPSMSTVVKMLEREMPVEKPPNPFPYSDSSHPFAVVKMLEREMPVEKPPNPFPYSKSSHPFADSNTSPNLVDYIQKLFHTSIRKWGRKKKFVEKARTKNSQELGIGGILEEQTRVQIIAIPQPIGGVQIIYRET